MPDTEPVIGVEFLALGIRNSDGAWTSVYVTVTNAQRRFTVRTVNESPLPARFLVTGGGAPEINVTVPPGEKADWNTGNRRYHLLDRIEIRAA